MTDIKIPNVGESVSEVTIATWLKKAGDSVKKDEAIVELETDKASQELVSPEDGTLEEILVAEGDVATIGQVIAKLGSGSGAKKSASKKETSKKDDSQKDDSQKDDSKKEASKKEAPEKETLEKEASEKETPKKDETEKSGSAVDINVPNVGESVSEVTIANWMKQVGDSVEKDEPLVELETDKAAQELVAPQAGVILEHLVAEGDVAKVGQTIARRGESGSKASAKNSSDSEDESEDEPESKQGSENSDKIAMPSAARILKENGLNAADIEGTGKDGRITKADALNAKHNPPAKSEKPAPDAAPKTPSAPRELGEREERVRMSRLRQTIARRLKDAQNTAAMLTTYNEADMSHIMAMRSDYKELFLKKHGIKLGFMSFFVKACVQALKDVPSVNAEIDGTDIIYKNYYDISIAVGTDKGLVVPVLRDCDELSLGGIEKGIGKLGEKARDGQLSMDDMSGGTFTISNGGVYGSLMSSPILNPPQSGILGMHKIQERPVVVDGKIEIRPMMYLALSYDHRIVDGKEAVTFLVRVKECLEDPERLLLDL